MKRYTKLALLFSLITQSLFAQKKEDNSYQPYFSIMSGYSATGYLVVPLNLEYQIRYKKIGIGAGFTTEYAASKGGTGRVLSVGEVATELYSSIPIVYEYSEKWVKIAPSLSVYYYLNEKERLSAFIKTGLIGNYNAWNHYEGLEYKTDDRRKVVSSGFNAVSRTLNSIDLQTINLLIGAGVLYKVNKKLSLRISSEVQWGRNVSVLGGVFFKI